MKKDTFIRGALISTICVILSKVLGIIYVIPFNHIIGAQGGALYGYAYNIYNIFLSLSTVGIPFAISKIVSEYSSLEFHDAKRRSYKVASYITTFMAIVSTLILIIFAPAIADAIKGGIEGGNSLEDITFVIRVSATAILFVTILSNMRGYLQGQRYIANSSISQVVEQLIRVIIIVSGSYVFAKIYGIKEAVGIAVFGATIGAIVSIIYLYTSTRKVLVNKDEHYEIKEEEKKMTNKFLAIKLIKYTIPFIMTSVITSLYASADMFTIIKTLVNDIGYSVNKAEFIMSCISTWGAKLNVIVTSVATGIVISLLPNITSDYALKNYEGIRRKTTKTIQIIIVVTLPMVVGLCLLANPVWTIFYGNSALGTEVFAFSIFTALFNSLFMNVNIILQSVDHLKSCYISLFSGTFLKIILNIPLMILFDKLGLPGYYGSIAATILGLSLSIIISLVDLNKSFKVKYKETFKISLVSVLACALMSIVIIFLQNYIGVSNLGGMKSLIITGIYGLIGALIYGSIMVLTKIDQKVFGINVLKKIPLLKKL